MNRGALPWTLGGLAGLVAFTAAAPWWVTYRDSLKLSFTVGAVSALVFVFGFSGLDSRRYRTLHTALLLGGAMIALAWGLRLYGWATAAPWAGDAVDAVTATAGLAGLVAAVAGVRSRTR